LDLLAAESTEGEDTEMKQGRRKLLYEEVRVVLGTKVQVTNGGLSIFLKRLWSQVSRAAIYIKATLTQTRTIIWR
jgi:hypothetical protein